MKREDKKVIGFYQPRDLVKNGCKWDLNTCLHQPETYPGIKVVAILKPSTAIDHLVTTALCWFKHVSI